MTKTSDLSKLRSFFNNVTNEKTVSALRSFFMGKWYPIWIAFSVLVGRFTCLEVYFAMLDILLVSIALLVCDSIRPVLPNLITFLYRIPLEHSPAHPNYSDYYTTEPSVKLIIVFMALFLASLVYFYIKHKSFVGFNPLKQQLFIPTLAFATTFFTAGVLSGNKQEGEFLFALMEFLVFFIVFYILYLGLRMEKFDELVDYFVYIATICAGILIIEVIYAFLTLDTIIKNGSINKFAMLFGWGISNTCANVLSVIIPLSILGSMRTSRKWSAVIYLGMSALTLLASVSTMSRTAAIFGTLAFIIFLAVSCFAGKNKSVSRIMALIVALALVGAFVCFKDKIMLIFNRYIEKGFTVGARELIWKNFLMAFKDNPIFGKGFFGFEPIDYVPPFYLVLAHNTIIQILGSMGAVGLIAYIVYRVFTFIPFFKSFTMTKFLLLGSCAVLVFESLIDNFIFWFNPTFVYNICIVLAVMHCEQTKREKLKDAGDVRDVVCDNVEKTSSVEENT